MNSTRRTLAAAAAATLLVTVVVACATNPATGERQLALIGEQQEIAIGRDADRDIAASLGLYPDDEVQRYVDRVGQQLAAASERPDLPWTFRVVDDPVVNAFALPGGFIYVTRGLLTHLENEAELAGVIGHEIGHVTGRHGVERMSRAQLAGLGLGIGAAVEPGLARYAGLAQTGMQLMFLKYGRDDERQADSLGLRYMTRKGYDPRQLVEVFDVLERVSAASGAGRIPGWLSTHPAPENRRQLTEAALADYRPGVAADRVNADAYLDTIDGMVFGDDPRQGFFEGSTFYHPEMAFRLDFPDGWQTRNQRSAVTAASPSGDAVVVLGLAEGSDSGNAARDFFAQQGLTRTGDLSSGFSNPPATGGYFSVTSQDGTAIDGAAAFVELGGRVFRLLGYTRSAQWETYRSPMVTSLASFSRLTERSKLEVEPNRIDVFTLGRDMTLEEINWRNRSAVDLDVLALINQVDPQQVLPEGTRIKRVVRTR